MAGIEQGRLCFGAVGRPVNYDDSSDDSVESRPWDWVYLTLGLVVPFALLYLQDFVNPDVPLFEGGLDQWAPVSFILCCVLLVAVEGLSWLVGRGRVRSFFP